MKTIATVNELAEAHLLRSVLAGSGVQAFIPDEETASIAPPYVFNTGIRVQVAEADEAAAREVLANHEGTANDPAS